MLQPRLAIVLIVTAAEAICTAIAALRAVHDTLLCCRRQDKPRRAVAGVIGLIEIRHAIIWIAQVSVISFRAVGQWNLVIGLWATLVAGRQANAWIAGVAVPALGAGRQAVIAEHRFAGRASGLARLGWGWTAAGGAAAGRRHWWCAIALPVVSSSRHAPASKQHERKQEDRLQVAERASHHGLIPYSLLNPRMRLSCP